MKYFTRPLFDAMQTDDEAQFNIAHHQWSQNTQAYRQSLALIRERLPESLQSFCDTTLHDSVLTSLEVSGDDCLLCLDAAENPWGPTGEFRLQFGRIHSLDLGNLAVGDIWLYEETHLHEHAAFEYRIMFDSVDIAISADRFSVASRS